MEEAAGRCGLEPWLKMTSAAVNEELAAVSRLILSKLTGLDLNPGFFLLLV